jgi:hypothetical protein
MFSRGEILAARELLPICYYFIPDEGAKETPWLTSLIGMGTL